jgi:hypothetical protein
VCTGGLAGRTRQIIEGCIAVPRVLLRQHTQEHRSKARHAIQCEGVASARHSEMHVRESTHYFTQECPPAPALLGHTLRAPALLTCMYAESQVLMLMQQQYAVDVPPAGPTAAHHSFFSGSSSLASLLRVPSCWYFMLHSNRPAHSAFRMFEPGYIRKWYGGVMTRNHAVDTMEGQQLLHDQQLHCCYCLWCYALCCSAHLSICPYPLAGSW